MNFRLKLFLAMVLCFAALGCASQQVTELEKPIGDPYIFVFSDESKVFSIAYHALSREVDKSLIKELNGPVKGFYATIDSWGGKSNFWVRIFAANGANAQGRNTYGYYGEVMVEGDKGKEREQARKIFSDMEAMFAQQGQKVHVRNRTRAKYRGDSVGDYRAGSYDFDSAPHEERPERPVGMVREPGRYSDPTQMQQTAPPLPGDPDLVDPARGEYVPEPRKPVAPGTVQAPSMAEELEKLYELREKGIISDEDFQKGKNRILSNW